MDLNSLLGDEAGSLLTYECKGIPRDDLILPGPDIVDAGDELVGPARSRCCATWQPSTTTGRLGGTGYLSILPVDQGIEHSAAASFARNPAYFDPKNIVELAIEGGCNAVATTFGVLGMVARRYAHKIPFIAKLNHNELLTYPNQLRPDHVRLGPGGLRARCGRGRRHHLLRFGAVHPPDPGGLRGLPGGPRARHVHRLWCYLRNNAFKKDGVDYSLAADLTGQANHLGVTIEADIIKQKQAENNGGYPPSASAGPTRWSTTSSPPTTPST